MTHVNLREAHAKNPRIPGARVLHRSDARAGYHNLSGTRRWYYPVSEVNDLAVFEYVEKDAESDADRPWIRQLHPEITSYLYVLEGVGWAEFGGPGSTFRPERYEFGAEDLVVVPRGVPYRLGGAWSGLFFHFRTSVFGAQSGSNRLPHPTIAVEVADRPTPQERDALPAPGELVYSDPLGLVSARCAAARFPETLAPQFPGLAGPGAQVPDLDAARELYAAVTPNDELTSDPEAVREASANPEVLGARVIRRTDAPDVYNSNAAAQVWLYPLGWTDDLALFLGVAHLAASDEERPFDSHSHPDIEEYKYILKGSGTTSYGVGDSTVETETYPFQAGDLVINPRDVPHLDAGDYVALCFHARRSVFGKTPGTSRTPHPAYVYTKPPRPTPEEQAALNDPGTYLLMDSREELLLYLPNPIERVGEHQLDLGWLRPDLFGPAEDQRG